jgi:hypothetical protein
LTNSLVLGQISATNYGICDSRIVSNSFVSPTDLSEGVEESCLDALPEGGVVREPRVAVGHVERGVGQGEAVAKVVERHDDGFALDQGLLTDCRLSATPPICLFLSANATSAAVVQSNQAYPSTLPSR